MKFVFGILIGAAALWAQPQPPPAPWRGAGPTPCVGAEGGIYKCSPAPRSYAVRAGHLFDSKTGQMLTKQVVLVSGDRITEVGPASQVKIPAGVEVIDLSQATVLPGLIDAHTHMFNQRKPNGTTEEYMLIAVQNVQNNLRAGFTAARDMTSHGNGYGDVAVRDAINQGRIDGPRYQVSTRGIVWSANAIDPAAPVNPLNPIAVHTVEEARAAVREEIAHGADWIKLYPAGAYSFNAAGKDLYEVTYPLPVVQALIDETHRLGKKNGCHVYGGEGQKNAIIAGCDTIEHGFGLDQEQINMMAAKGLFYDPTIVRYTEPYMDDNDKKNTGGKYRIIPIFDQSRHHGSRHQRHQGHGRQWSRWLDLRARHTSSRIRSAGEARRPDAGARDSIRNYHQRRSAGMAGSDRVRRKGQVRGSGCGLGRSARRHHRTAARQVRHEGRKSHPQRHSSRRSEVILK